MSSARRRRERVLEQLTELRELPIGGAPAAAFKERLRAELLSGALDPEPEPAGPAHRRRRPRRRPLLSQLSAVGLAAALMVSSFATYQAVPGDSLYPLKRAAETTLVHLSSDDAQRGERELDSAQTRAREVASLLGSSADGPLVKKTLKDMEESTRAGISRLERTEPRSPKIKKFAQEQEEAVKPMLQELDEDQLAQAEGYLDYIEGLAAPE
ncbi:hypothetical protein HD597_009783 [Nonomuraea thailandensis]|uniref:DUF5667 domain-containing protein n=1 Tax=Nonomuraea thailandensis TaxID=1188745 RepID=A0A9X2GXJ6_9ACTN|nr:DUF5667 domain-containing protein [Nonomuraea thailandensis]MCP2362763.1 hypothetical protein [Nonomuraea thailandensis]